MKERIIIENKEFIEYFKHTDNDYYEHRVEQVPETFEELKELCKGLKGDIIWNKDYCEIKNFKISKDGNIYYRQIQIYYDGTITKNYITVINNRTIPQLWAFIESLIGEE